jgi:hypothetical protein
MQTRDLYHGTTGDNILEIIRQGRLRPAAGKIYFSERRFDSVFMHGADRKRKATYAVKMRVTIPTAASLQQAATAGVSDTLIITTEMPLQVQILELYIREPRGSTVTTIRGAREITKHLSA